MQTMQTCQKGNTWAEWEAWSNTDVDLRSFRSFMIILKLKIIHVLIYTIIWFEYRSAYAGPPSILNINHKKEASLEAAFNMSDKFFLFFFI